MYVFGGSLTLIVPRRWPVVAFHEPYYNSQGTYQLGTYFQQNLEALFCQFGVDIVITGHIHAYERSFPVYKGVVRLPLSAASALEAGQDRDPVNAASVISQLPFSPSPSHDATFLSVPPGNLQLLTYQLLQAQSCTCARLARVRQQ